MLQHWHPISRYTAASSLDNTDERQQMESVFVRERETVEGGRTDNQGEKSNFPAFLICGMKVVGQFTAD